MQINPNSPLRPVPTVGNSPWAPVKPRGEQGTVDFKATEALEKALERAPDVRPEKVEKARQEVGQVDYPPKETIQRISQLLALNWDTSNQ